MAINKSNSIYVNIGNLPQTQEAVDGDLVILQTQNGTQTIPFQNFNVVRTDIAGNATVTGNLTGNSFTITSLDSQSISGAAFFSDGIQGTTTGLAPTPTYNNFFSVVNGLVTSASYVLSGSPDYTTITRIFVPSVTAYQSTIYKKLIDIYSSVQFFTNGTQTVAINNFFTNYPDVGNASLIKPSHFTVMADANLSGAPFVTNITQVSQNLQFVLNVTGVGVAGSANVYWRLLYAY
jgi:hypothetical protein